MAQSIEAFINKLQSDGVEAGETQAAKIRQEAEQQAQQIIQEAEAKAKRIVDDAKAESESTRSRTQTELKLAARDTVNRLQATLTDALKGVLHHEVDAKLADTDFVGALIKDIVDQYVKADIEGTGSVTINVSDEMRHQLADWAVNTLHKSRDEIKTLVDLHGTLKGAGFEYQAIEGTIEVTVDSVVELLSNLVGPEVRKLVQESIKE